MEMPTLRVTLSAGEMLDAKKARRTRAATAKRSTGDIWRGVCEFSWTRCAGDLNGARCWRKYIVAWKARVVADCNQPALRVSNGSTLVARRAGSQLASQAIERKISGARAKVRRSCALVL